MQLLEGIFMRGSCPLPENKSFLSCTETTGHSLSYLFFGGDFHISIMIPALVLHTLLHTHALGLFPKRLQLHACLCVYFWKLTTWPTCALLLLVQHEAYCLLWDVLHSTFHQNQTEAPKKRYVCISDSISKTKQWKCRVNYKRLCSVHSPFDDDGHMEYLFLEKRHWGQSTMKKTEEKWHFFTFQIDLVHVANS